MGFAYTKMFPRGTDINSIDLNWYREQLDSLSLENEEWRDIPEFEGLYQASTLGRIRSLPRAKMDKIGRIALQCGNILKKLNGSDTGHSQVILHKEGKAYVRAVHRLVAAAFLPNPCNYSVVNHIDGDPTNDSVENLEWCTPKHNTRHAIQKGLFKPKRHPGMYGYNPDEKYSYEADVLERTYEPLLQTECDLIQNSKSEK